MEECIRKRWIHSIACIELRERIVSVCKARQYFHMNFMALRISRSNANFLGPVVSHNIAFKCLLRASAKIDDHIESKKTPKIVNSSVIVAYPHSMHTPNLSEYHPILPTSTPPHPRSSNFNETIFT